MKNTTRIAEPAFDDQPPSWKNDERSGEVAERLKATVC
jgi:hypothetical protein